MAINYKISGKASSIPAGLVWGAAVSVITTITVAAILALLLEQERIPWNSVGYGLLIMVMLSAFLGAAVSYHKIRHMRLMICLMSGVVYFGILLSVTALFFGGQYEAVGVTALLIAGGCLCAALLDRGEGRRGRRRTKRKRNESIMSRR